MIAAWSTESVYAAERALMATLDDGELMARAVAGLAGVAAARLQDRGGEAVAALVGPGNNGADALYAVARLAEAGWNAVAVHHDHLHEGARAAATPARPSTARAISSPSSRVAIRARSAAYTASVDQASITFRVLPRRRRPTRCRRRGTGTGAAR